MSNFAERMSRMANTDAFKAAKEAAKQSGFSSGVPDGDYIAAVVKAAWDESKPGKELVKWALLILHDKEGDTAFANKTVYDNSRFETEENIGYFLKRLHVLGVDIDEFDIVEDMKDTLAWIASSKPKVEITLKTKNEYQNAYINRLLEEESGYEPTPNAPSAPAASTAPSTGSEPPARTRRRRTTTAAPEPDPTPAPAAAETAEGADEAETEMVPGLRITWNSSQGEARVGTIERVDDENQALYVKRDDNGAVVGVKMEQVTGLADEPADAVPFD